MPIRTKTLVVAAALTAVAPFAVAQEKEPPQVARYHLMEKNGDMAKLMGAMVKGEQRYDADAAGEALDTIISDVREFVTLFPPDSKTGYDTEALPIIWEDWSGFTEHADKLIAAAEAAKEAAPKGLDAFRPAFGAMGNACRACHETYRAKS